jgi:hypothetical protein
MTEKIHGTAIEAAKEEAAMMKLERIPPSAHPNPIQRFLRQSVLNWENLGHTPEVGKAVLAYGRPFVGIARPRGYRLGPPSDCYRNAGALATDDREDYGTYVEGYAMSPRGGSPMQHAWLTLDGTNAVDVTWRHSAEECQYFGIPFSNEVLNRFILRMRVWGELLRPDELQQVLLDAGLL